MAEDERRHGSGLGVSFFPFFFDLTQVVSLEFSYISTLLCLSLTFLCLPFVLPLIAFLLSSSCISYPRCFPLLLTNALLSSPCCSPSEISSFLPVSVCLLPFPFIPLVVHLPRHFLLSFLSTFLRRLPSFLHFDPFPPSL